MAAQAKPDSSHASNRITRNNPPAQHLLSTFNKLKSEDAKIDVATISEKAVQPSHEKKPDIDTDAEPLGSDEEEVGDLIAQPSIEKTPENDIDTEPLSSPPLSSPPLSSDEEEAEDLGANAAQTSIKTMLDIDTDADPLSSDEEQASDSDASSRRKEVNYTTTTLEKKLAEGNNRAYDSPQTRNGSSRKGNYARTLSAMMGSDDEDDIFLFSSQSHKRQRATKYASKPSTYFNRPSFPSRSTEKAKTSLPDEEPPKEPEETFIMPKDIESSSFREPRGGEDPNSSFSRPYTMEECEAMLLDDDSPLSSPSSSTCEQISQLDEVSAKEDPQPSSPRKALCPMCHKEVDWDSLELFKSQPKQRIREQVMFCDSHKLRSAMDLWRERGYPKIDWDGFEERVQGYFPELEKLLIPGAFSYYRNILDTSFAPGKARNFRMRVSDSERLETMACGYYGAMGATKILETIIRRFSVVIRRLATTDELIKTTGVAGYTQSVLVPELAVLMVKDDMKVNDEDARRILRESMDIGYRVNPDLNVVPIQEDVEV